MSKRFVVSYKGRTVAQVDLRAVKEKSIRGNTLHLKPRTTEVLTEEELAEIKKVAPDAFKALVVHREVKPKKKAEAKLKIEEKPKASGEKDKPGKKKKTTTSG